MYKHLKYIDGSSDKFWEIQTNGSSHTVSYGRNGTDGQQKTKTFESEELCLKDAEKLVNEKIKKGYSEDGTVQVTERVPKANTGSSSRSKGKFSKEEVVARFKELVRRPVEEEIIPFLEEYGSGNMELIKKEIKAAKRYYLTYQDLSKDPGFNRNRDYTWGIRATNQQKQWIHLIGLASMSLSDLASWPELIELLNMSKNPMVIKILDWAKPNWLLPYMLQEFRKDEWLVINYWNIRHLEELGHIEFDPALYAVSLARINMNIYNGKEQDIIENLLRDELTISRDIPTLFTYETVISNIHIYDSAQTGVNLMFWDVIFDRLMAEGRLDKEFVLTSALEAQTKDWNNNLKGFFRKLILRMDLPEETLLKHQESIFPLLHTEQSNSINFAIGLLKPLTTHAKFHMEEYLSWIQPVFMRVDMKTGIKGLIIHFDKLLKANPKLSSTVINLVSDVFMIPDLQLQERVVKFIDKHQKADDSELREKLQLYSGQMMGTVSKDLQRFMAADGESYSEEEILAVLQGGESEPYQYSPEPVERLTQEIAVPSTWNDLLFMIGQTIHSESTVDIEVLMNAWMVNQKNFQAEDKKQLEPYINQLKRGHVESAAFQFFQAAFLNIYYNPKQAKYSDNKYSKQSKLVSLMDDILFLIQQRIIQGIDLPLLSLPSHEPHWVAPAVLLDRILQYQQQNQPLDLLDLSIAMSRCPREQLAQLQEKLGEVKDEEIRNLLAYAFGFESEMPIKKEGWLQSLLNKAAKDKVNMWGVLATIARSQDPEGIFPEFSETKLLADAPFAVKPYRPEIAFKPYYVNEYNYLTKANYKVLIGMQMLLEFPKFESYPENFLYAKDIFSRGEKNPYYYYFYAKDVTYGYSLMPLNPEAVTLMYNKFYNLLPEFGSKVNIPVLQQFLYPFYRLDNQSVLFLACSCFHKEKEVRAHVVEVIIRAIEENRLPDQLFAEHLIALFNNDYGPVGRFADILEQLKDISSKQNHFILQVLDVVFQHLLIKEKMPTNLKKFFELFFDLQQKENYSLSDTLKGSLSKFDAYKSIQPLIKKILK